MSAPLVLALRAVLAIVLYVFLAWALFTIGRELKQAGKILSTRRIPPISLQCRRATLAPQTRHFFLPEITIGRNPSCEFEVDEDTISSRHARLLFHHGQWWVEDLGSTNGTLLNDNKLDMPTVVISGDELRCGEVSFVVSYSSEVTTSPDTRGFANG